MSFHTDLILIQYLTFLKRVPALQFIGVCVQVPFKRVCVFLAKVRTLGFVGVLVSYPVLPEGLMKKRPAFQVVGSDNKAS